MADFKSEEMGLAGTILATKVIELLKAKGLIAEAEAQATFDAALAQLNESSGAIAPGAARFLRHLLGRT